MNPVSSYFYGEERYPDLDTEAAAARLSEAIRCRTVNHEDRSLTAFGEKGLFWSAWTSSCYFWMADRYGRD